MTEYTKITVDFPEETIALRGNAPGEGSTGAYYIELTKPGASAHVSGIFDASGDVVIDQEIIIHHKAPHTRAEVVLKGAGRDSSFTRFVGRIIIDEDCGDSNSFLTERILLLSESARAEAVPDLEIKTDDVKCSHAASISHIPQEQLFYLMSRGIAQADAEDMIVEGFLEL